MKLKTMLSGCIIAASLLLAAPTAMASLVYDASAGSWAIKGYAENGERSCVISTYWGDGKFINLNVFPNSGNITVTVNNPDWSIAPGYNYDEVVYFVYDSGTVTKTTVRFAYKNPQRLIMRNVHRGFIDGFLGARSMVIFNGMNDELIVDLSGTNAVGAALAECESVVFEY